MPVLPPRKSPSELARHRASRAVKIQSPDIHSTAFAEEAHRQSLAVANSPHENEDQDFVDSISILNDE
jgi:hypothetical protein